jgi:hypothetical protein
MGNLLSSLFETTNDLLANPTVILLLVIIVVVYMTMFMSLGNSTNYQISNASSFSILNIIFLILLVLFIILILSNGLQYFFNFNIFNTLLTSLKNFFISGAEVDITINEAPPIPEIMLNKQVFNIPGNEYTYPDAKALCTAYGARLATYKEVEDSYNKGGEWCNYGWSDGQMALFPTQQKTFDVLQTIPGHENDCGRPGVNGGYMENKKIRFGVNCYGNKPKMTQEEEDLMESSSIYPKTLKDKAMEQRVSYWQSKLNEILVSPFNQYRWSKI